MQCTRPSSVYIYHCSETIQGWGCHISSIRCRSYYFFLLFILAGLLIEGSVYFVQVVQCLFRSGGIARPDMDPGSSTCSLSVLLSAVEMSLKHKQPLVSVWQGNARLIFHRGPNKDTYKINYATSNIWVFYLRSQQYVGSKHTC